MSDSDKILPWTDSRRELPPNEEAVPCWLPDRPEGEQYATMTYDCGDGTLGPDAIVWRGEAGETATAGERVLWRLA